MLTNFKGMGLVIKAENDWRDVVASATFSSDYYYSIECLSMTLSQRHSTSAIM